MNLLYANEKLHAAMYSMATSHGSLQHRLASAGVALAIIGPKDMPDEETAEMFRELWERMTAVKNEQLGALDATARTLSDDDASQLARKLADIAARVDFAVRYPNG